MKLEKEYLLNCTKEELIDILLNIPLVKEQVTLKFKLNLIRELEKKIPNELLSNYYLAETHGEASNALKTFILNTFNGGEIALLFTHYDLLRTIIIKTN